MFETVIVDYGMGNLRSVEKAVEAVVLGQGVSDSAGRAEMEVWLDAQQQKGGEFLAAISSGETSRTAPLPELVVPFSLSPEKLSRYFGSSAPESVRGRMQKRSGSKPFAF